MGKKNFYKYDLDVFNIQSKKAPVNFKFLGSLGYLKRKTFKYLDRFNAAKNFYTESRDKNKNTLFNEDAIQGNFKDTLHVEGHFETEKYFKNYMNDVKKEFIFKNVNYFKKTQIYKDIKNSNSVCICVRQNRFSERKRAITKKDEENSLIFTKDQIDYIKKSINIINSRVENPKFFLWSNDHKNLTNYFPVNEFTPVSTKKIDSDLFLMTQAKHFVVIPSSYNWWGAWLSDKNNGIILRPSDSHFSNFSLNNRDFWPDSWTKV